MSVGCGGDAFEDKATATCEEAYRAQVGAEFPDRSEAAHRAFLNGCVEVEKQRRAELGPDYEPG